MKESRALVDSSIWLPYFLATSQEVREIIDSQDTLLFTSSITLHEVKRKLLKLNYTSMQAEKAIQFIRENSVVIPVDEDIAVNSVNHCMKSNLHTVDSIIYETAMQNKCKLVTADKDFKGLKDALVLKCD